MRASESRLIRTIAADELGSWHEAREKSARVIQRRWRWWKRQPLNPTVISDVAGSIEDVIEDNSSDDASEQQCNNGVRDSQQKALHLKLCPNKRKLCTNMVGRQTVGVHWDTHP